MKFCNKCNSSEMFIEKKSTNTGLYCQECGAWQKWLNKAEVRAFNFQKDNKHFKNDNKPPFNPFENDDRLPFDESPVINRVINIEGRKKSTPVSTENKSTSANTEDKVIKEPMVTVEIPLRLYNELMNYLK